MRRFCLVSFSAVFERVWVSSLRTCIARNGSVVKLLCFFSGVFLGVLLLQANSVNSRRATGMIFFIGFGCLGIINSYIVWLRR